MLYLVLKWPALHEATSPEESDPLPYSVCIDLPQGLMAMG
jgi:hypothetical protein